MPHALIFTHASVDDTAYLYQLFEVTMRGYVETTWGVWSDSVARDGIADGIARRTVSLVRLGEEVVGAMWVENQPTHLHLDKLFIEPAFQNRGIGTQIIEELTRRAHAEGKPVRLRVLVVNPARRLYERLGFVVTETTPERYYMEHP